MDRRDFLAGTIAAAGMTALGASGAAEWLTSWQDPLARFDRGFAAVHEIADGVYAMIAEPSKGLQCVSNGGMIVGKKAVLIVEGHLQPQGAALEIEVARSVSKTRVRAAVDTHYHFDHRFGNGAYADEKISIIAHERTTAINPGSGTQRRVHRRPADEQHVSGLHRCRRAPLWKGARLVRLASRRNKVRSGARRRVRQGDGRRAKGAARTFAGPRRSHDARRKKRGRGGGPLRGTKEKIIKIPVNQ